MTKKVGIFATLIPFGVAMILSFSSLGVYIAQKNKTEYQTFASNGYESSGDSLLLGEKICSLLSCKEDDIFIENSCSITTNSVGLITKIDLEVNGKNADNKYFSAQVNLKDYGSFELSVHETANKDKGTSFMRAMECVSLWNPSQNNTEHETMFHFANETFSNPKGDDKSFVLKDHKLDEISTELQGTYSDMTIWIDSAVFQTVYF